MIPHRRALACVGLLFSSRAAAQQIVKIDDANVYSLANPNGIQYSAKGWTTVNADNIDLRHDSTYTWSQTATSNLVYFFRGTAIAHYADMGPNRGPVGVAIDGHPYENVTWGAVGTTVQYQQQMWNITGLSQGDHQVVISNVGTGNTATSIVGVDYLEVTAGADGSIIPSSSGPGASGIPSNAVLVDDSSNLISYSGSSWDVYTSSDHIGVYLGGTQHSSTSPGGLITFSFNGTAIWYFCDQYENNTVVSISLDGASPDRVNTASPTGIWLTQILTWSRTGLTDGPHTVTITHAGIDGTYANVDFFKYMASVNSPAASSASASPSSTAAAAASNAGAKSTPVGAIVGGVVGGVALIAFILGLVIWKWKRHPAQDPSAPAHETYAGDAAYGGKEAYAQPGSAYGQSPPGTPGFAPSMNYQHQGMQMPMQQTQNLGGGPNSITPTTWTGATYAGHPEIH